MQDACDLLRPVYDGTGHADGYVSIEVPPALAYDTQRTVAEAHRLHDVVDRPNLMVKIPGTQPGIAAIRRTVADGLHINITLLFALDAYEQVVDAYFGGLEERVARREPIDDAALAWRASSCRGSTRKADREIDELLSDEADPLVRARLEGLRGKLALANAKLAYRRFLELSATDRWHRLAERGAHAQRVLWASTSTKDPSYDDLLYVDNLIGPQTVDTMPEETLAAFLDHGVVRRTVDRGRRRGARPRRAGRAPGRRPEGDHRRAAGRGRVAVSRVIRGAAAERRTQARRAADRRGAQAECLTSRPASRRGERVADDPVLEAIDRRLRSFDEERFGERLFGHDATLWKDDPKHREIIAQRLGWLSVADDMLGKSADLPGFAGQVARRRLHRRRAARHGRLEPRARGLPPHVRGGRGLPRPAHLRLDRPAGRARPSRRRSTSSTPCSSSRASPAAPPRRPRFHAYFYERLSELVGAGQAGRHFVAITDPETSLHREALAQGFRAVFLNPPDIGGRYSALSYFGLVPAALIGVDLERLLERAAHVTAVCPRRRPGARASGLQGGRRPWRARPRRPRQGHLLRSRRRSPRWAPGSSSSSPRAPARRAPASCRSTASRRARPRSTAPTGCSSYLALEGQGDERGAAALAALAAAGHPTMTLTLPDLWDVAAEFVRWELAVAAAGAVLGIDPFDQPNVQESKDNTKRLLPAFSGGGALPPLVPGPDGRHAGRGRERRAACRRRVRELLAAVHPGDYVALQAYLPPTAQHDRILQGVRLLLRDRFRVATTLGYGPRFLHSTGQLHKGGGADRRLRAAHPLGAPGTSRSRAGPTASGSSSRPRRAAISRRLAGRGLRVLSVDLGPEPLAGLTAFGGVVADLLRLPAAG